MTSNAIADWCRFSPTGIVLIDPGSPWQHPFVEQFHTLLEAEIMAEDYRQDYNQHRPRSSLGYLTPNKFMPDWNHHQGLTKELAHETGTGQKVLLHGDVRYVSQLFSRYSCIEGKCKVISFMAEPFTR